MHQPLSESTERMGKIMASQKLTGRAASMSRRRMQVNGKAAATGAAPAQVRAQTSAAPSGAMPAPNSSTAGRYVAGANQGTNARAATLARRKAMSAHGKRGVKSSDRQRTADDLHKDAAANSGNGECGCGGECCSQAKGQAGEHLATPSLASPVERSAKRVVKKSRVSAQNTGRLVAKARRSATSAKGKTGLDAHSKGISSASLARQANPDITSRDLARAVRDQRSRVGAKGAAGGQSSRRQRIRSTEHGVSGTRVSHSEKLTGDETGLCNTGVTGTEYMGAEVFEKFCKTEPPRYPAKVSVTETFSGSHVTTGGRVGSSERVTGADKGSCRNVTGSEYLGKEHFASQCETTPQAGMAKVSRSHTQRGTVVSGPSQSRAERVTGNEKGTCKAITGTPYASYDDYKSFCSTEELQETRKRQTARRVGAGRDISGIQPGLKGERMTGAEAGACSSISGTPYLGATEIKEVCGAQAAAPGEDDFPQPLTEMSATADAPQSPAPRQVLRRVVTGSGYEGSGAITGAFSMAQGKVTGTEQARFGERGRQAEVIKAAPAEEPSNARVTGEGIDTGLKITGDDWDRGDRVTGTEGSSVIQRNPTKRGPMSAMPQIAEKREPVRDRPSANVTGGSGGSEGATVTVTGGARG